MPIWTSRSKMWWRETASTSLYEQLEYTNRCKLGQRMLSSQEAECRRPPAWLTWESDRSTCGTWKTSQISGTHPPLKHANILVSYKHFSWVSKVSKSCGKCIFTVKWVNQLFYRDSVQKFVCSLNLNNKAINYTSYFYREFIEKILPIELHNR